MGVINGQIVAHTGVIQFPMRKGWKRVHRLVVLPDFQGIGIGMVFINAICDEYKNNGMNMNLTTTTPALIHSMIKDPLWALVRKGRNKSNFNYFGKYGKGKHTHTDFNHLMGAKSSNRITFSFNFK